MKTRFTIGRKIAVGYGLILTIMLISGGASIIALRNSRAIDKKMAEIRIPSGLRVKEFRALVAEVETLTNSWIYQPLQKDKDQLKAILTADAPALKKSLDNLSAQWEFEYNVDTYKRSWGSFSNLLKSSERVMGTLNTVAAYDSAELIEGAIGVYEKEVQPLAKDLDANLLELFNKLEETSQRINEEKYRAFDRTEWMTILFTILSILLGGGFAWYTTQQITKPVEELKETITSLSIGKLPNAAVNKRTDDEIGDMVTATEELIAGLKSTSTFAGEIGKGSLDAPFQALSDSDVLGNSLILMRNNLKKNADAEHKRNWAVAGLAKFGELLRNQDQDLEKFGDQVLSFTVKYSQANQGRLYVVNDDDKNDQHLQMISCYAWDKKKFLQQKILKGEGLTGQCWQEGEPIYMTKLPDNYVQISSGLGTANPNNILIVPLKVNDAIYGIIEIASFKLLQDFEREFLMKLSENLAAAIGTVRVNQKTKTLLAQTQQQAEEMRSQEEEMRQNMEELSATQEEMSRKEREYISRIEELEKNVK
jgi:methyl-accepting chemotaxis protein